MAKQRKIIKANIEHNKNKVELAGGQARGMYTILMSRPSAASRQKADATFLRKVAEQAPDALLTVQQFDQTGDDKPELTHAAQATVSTAVSLSKTTDEVTIAELMRSEVEILQQPIRGRGGSGFSPDALAEALGI